MPVQLKNIVVGYDGFERKEPIPPLALALAEEHGASLHVVHVSAEPPARSWWADNDEAAKVHAEVIAERSDRLEELLATARKKGIEATSTIRAGVPHVEIIREALSRHADLVVVADEPLHRSGERGFGTVTMKLFRCCPCPVLAKRDPRKYKHRSILAAVDLEPKADNGAQGLNKSIISMAEALTRRAGGKLTLFHAWNFWGESLLRTRGMMPAEQIEGLVAAQYQLREDEAKRLLADSELADMEVDIELVKGDARQLLPELADSKKIDLVVMGTVGRTGIKGFLMGNTAERTLNELSCSVLAVKPPLFECPIELES